MYWLTLKLADKGHISYLCWPTQRKILWFFEQGLLFIEIAVNSFNNQYWKEYWKKQRDVNVVDYRAQVGGTVTGVDGMGAWGCVHYGEASRPCMAAESCSGNLGVSFSAGRTLRLCTRLLFRNDGRAVLCSAVLLQSNSTPRGVGR